MPTNEDGEFELILGNRQLLSVFFIVVILLAVFFAMGFIVGRKVSPELAAAPKPEAKPLVVESPVRQPEPAKPEPKPDTAPAETAPQQPAPKPVETAKAEPPKVEPKPESAKETKKSKKEKAAAAAEATPGTYLQLVATEKREADIMVDLLRQKKFKAVAAGIPEKPDLYRVLVGPLPEGSLNRTKSELQKAGFPGDKAYRRRIE